MVTEALEIKGPLPPAVAKFESNQGEESKSPVSLNPQSI